MLPVPTGSDVCCVLKRSSYGWVWSPVRRPDKLSVANALVTQFRDFVLCSGKSLRSNDACATSPRSAAAMEEATHTSRAALRPGDSSGCEHISRPGLRCGEPSGFRSNARVCKFHPTNYSVNAREVSSRGFGCAASFCVLLN